MTLVLRKYYRSCLVVLLVIAGVGLLHRGVPLYDGVGFPDEPYRYVVPPAGITSQSPPSAISEELAAAGRTNSKSLYAASTEQGPQVLVYMPEKTLTSSSPAKKFFVNITPLAQSAAIKPVDGVVAGNIYRLSISTDANSNITYSDKSERGVIELRLPQDANPKSVMEFLSYGSKTWYQLDTTKTGTDIYQAVVSGAGDYAMVSINPYAKPSYSPERQQAINEALQQAKTNDGQPAKKNSSKKLVVAVVITIVILVIAGWLLSIRRANIKNERTKAKNKKAGQTNKS